MKPTSPNKKSVSPAWPISRSSGLSCNVALQRTEKVCRTEGGAHRPLWGGKSSSFVETLQIAEPLFWCTEMHPCPWEESTLTGMTLVWRIIGSDFMKHEEFFLKIFRMVKDGPELRPRSYLSGTTDWTYFRVYLFNRKWIFIFGVRMFLFFKICTLYFLLWFE